MTDLEARLKTIKESDAYQGEFIDICREAARKLERQSDEIERLQKLLCWVWEQESDKWSLVCDEEIEIHDIVATLEGK